MYHPDFIVSMNQPDFIVCSFMGVVNDQKMVKGFK